METFNKNCIWVVIGFSYNGEAHAQIAFDCYADAQRWIEKQEDGWTYTIEKIMCKTRVLPF